MSNFQKTIIEGDLWYIDNFLTQEELDFFKPFMDEKTGWYTTMRSPYKNILNKFVATIIPLDENGNSRVPVPEDEQIDYEILSGKGGLYEKIYQVIPPIVRPHPALQTFKYCTNEEIERDIKDEERSIITQDGLIEFDVNKVDYAMNWHSEWDSSSPVPPFKLSYSIYLNDDFEGGVLEFKHKPYKLKPKAGTLVAIPVTKEFTHRVTKITSGNWRHTLYGASWNDINNIPVSTAEDC